MVFTLPVSYTHLIGTFVDPRIEGGRLNKCAKDILAEIIQIDGEEYIHYKSLKPDVAIFRASAADEKGNVVFTEEGLITEALSEAQAVKNNGGVVLCQVKKILPSDTIRPYNVIVPAVLIDGIIVDPNQRMSMKTEEDPFMSGNAVGEREACQMKMCIRDRHRTELWNNDRNSRCGKKLQR